MVPSMFKARLSYLGKRVLPSARDEHKTKQREAKAVREAEGVVREAKASARGQDEEVRAPVRVGVGQEDKG